ncbi:hypothetical protein INR49_022886 [Caranx melampygus]|nr:hypothetical protein INR49_022886 [Caranx melampygus]
MLCVLWTRLTAQLVNALSLADHIPRVQSESAAKSIDWLFTNAQILGGAFIETSTHQPKEDNGQQHTSSTSCSSSSFLLHLFMSLHVTAAGSGPLTIGVPDVLCPDRPAQSLTRQRPSHATQSETSSSLLPSIPSIPSISSSSSTLLFHLLLSPPPPPFPPPVSSSISSCVLILHLLLLLLSCSSIPPVSFSSPVSSSYSTSTKNGIRSSLHFQNALNVKSVYVRAVAAYALTLHDPRSRGHLPDDEPGEFSYTERWPPSVPVLAGVRFGRWVGRPGPVQWSDSGDDGGRIQYAKPIMAWLTHDQNYGEALTLHSVDLAALTAYSAATTQRVLNQQVSIRYGKKQIRDARKTPPHPEHVTKDDDIIVSTDSGTGVATVKMKTVFYQTMASIQNCNFEFNIEMVGERTSPGNHLSLHLSLYLCFLPVHI